MGIYVANGYIYVADQTTGLQIYQFYGEGIMENSLRNSPGIKISPNLVKDNLMLEFAFPLENSISLSIYNALGQKMKDCKIEKGVKCKSIQIKELPAGIYFMGIKENEVYESLKFVVLK